MPALKNDRSNLPFDYRKRLYTLIIRNVKFFYAFLSNSSVFMLKSAFQTEKQCIFAPKILILFLFENTLKLNQILTLLLPKVYFTLVIMQV